MAESTLRRHLAALVRAGLIARHDSPNGKRYARRGADGQIARAFGLDLRPLLLRAGEIVRTAAETRAAQAELALAREAASLVKRDALKLAQYGQDKDLPGDWDGILGQLLEIHKRMRRKLALTDIRAIEAELRTLLGIIRALLGSETEKMDGSDVDSGRQYQNSNKDSCESELARKTGKSDAGSAPARTQAPTARSEPPIPLALVLKACPDILPYCDRPPRNWRDLVGAAATVRGMMGVSPSAWQDAQLHMGPEVAAVTLACILQRFTAIHSPGGYLRSLSSKAAAGAFSPGPMVMALLNTADQRAA
jgi:replication initiation protein RepC